MVPEHEVNPLDSLHPHDPEMDASQRAWLTLSIQSHHKVLDLGCGAGRTLVPMAGTGAHCTGVDCDGAALATCQMSLEDQGCHADLIEADFLSWLPSVEDTWDLVCCLGNTFCLLWQIDQAVEFLESVREHLAPGGRLVVDDIPGDLWPEVTQGRWQEGIDPGSGRQLVWAEDDAVFTLRAPAEADAGAWSLGPSDRPLRLWTAGSLHLAAIATGYSVPFVPPSSGVRVLTPTP